MYQNYDSREQEGGRRGGRTMRLLLLAGLLLGIAAIAAVAFTQRGEDTRPVSEAGGVKRVSTVDGANLATYDGNGWEPRFWSGMNMGDTLPGHHK